MKKFVLACLLGLGLFAGAATLGGATPAEAQGKIYYGPGGPSYAPAIHPYQRGFGRGYGAPRAYGMRRGYYGPRRGYYGPRRGYYGPRYNRW
jgi:hypothetical protein